MTKILPCINLFFPQNKPYRFLASGYLCYCKIIFFLFQKITAPLRYKYVVEILAEQLFDYLFVILWSISNREIYYVFESLDDNFINICVCVRSLFICDFIEWKSVILIDSGTSNLHNSQEQKVEQKLKASNGERVGSYWLIITVLVWDCEKILEIDSGNGCTHCENT